jgi:hypothetical protein
VVVMLLPSKTEAKPGLLSALTPCGPVNVAIGQLDCQPYNVTLITGQVLTSLTISSPTMRLEREYCLRRSAEPITHSPERLPFLRRLDSRYDQVKRYAASRNPGQVLQGQVTRWTREEDPYWIRFRQLLEDDRRTWKLPRGQSMLVARFVSLLFLDAIDPEAAWEAGKPQSPDDYVYRYRQQATGL